MDLSDSVPQMDAKQQTMMWQQNQYMGDSGIHSGATTQVTTVLLLNRMNWFDTCSFNGSDAVLGLFKTELLVFPQAPSVSSKHGPDDIEGMTEDMDMSRNMFGFDQPLEPGFTQEQVDGKLSEAVSFWKRYLPSHNYEGQVMKFINPI